jgi:hypothetical protein
VHGGSTRYITQLLLGGIEVRIAVARPIALLDGAQPAAGVGNASPPAAVAASAAQGRRF